MTRHILITGCSGGGKSTLLEALAKRGHSVVPEPGLRIVRDESARDGTALPWVDMHAFLKRAAEVAVADLRRMAGASRPVFYDRGLLDAAVGLKEVIGVPLSETLGDELPYAKRIILAPPWREIFVVTEDRQHSFEDASREYACIREAALELGSDILELPHADVQTRVGVVESAFGLESGK